MVTDEAATSFLAGGGELGQLTRTKDWSQTTVGPPDQWPQPLRTVLSLMLHTKAPMFLWWGPDLIQFYNDAYRPSLGNSGKHPMALGQRAADCWPEIWPVIKPLIDQVLAGGEATWHEDQLIPIYRNGQVENVYWTFGYSPVRDEANQVAGVLVICQETTRQVILAREEQERFRFAIEAARFGIWEVDPVTKVVRWDDRCASLFGLSSGRDIPYEEAIRHIHPDDAALVGKAIQVGMSPQSGGHYDLTYRTIGADNGQLRWVRFTGRGYFNLSGELYRFSGVAHEVTKETQARQQVEANAAYLQRVFRSAAVGMAIFQGPTFIIEVANPNVCALWGRTEAQVTGKPLFEALPEAAGQGFEELLTEVMRTGIPFVGNELPATINRNGQLVTVYFDFVYDVVPDADGQRNRILVTASDATERRQIRQQLEASEANLRSLFRQAPVAIAILRGPTFVVELANPGICTVWNRTEAQLLGRPIFEVLTETAGHGFEELLTTVLQTGVPYVGVEVPVPFLRDGQAKTVYVNFVYEPLRDRSDGPITGIVVVGTDVTEQVLTRQPVEQLLIRERELNELKSNFVTLASHEFRTPMGTILSSAALIGRYNGPDEGEKRERHVQRIRSAVHSLTGLLNDFLSLSQMEQSNMHGSPYPLTITTFCEEVIDDMQAVIKPSQRISYTHLSGQPTISVDGQMLKNILVNLLVNASKYSADGKEITLTTAVQASHLLLTVRDEGIGIPDADKDKLFINFFRARNANHIQGTGLGLYVVKRYVDLLKGTVTFTSQLDLGTIFTIQLPLFPLPT